MLCANCHHDGRQVPATWKGRTLAVCDDHKAYHERLAELKPLYAIGRFIPRQKPQFTRL